MAASTVAANGILENMMSVKSKKLSGAKRLMNKTVAMFRRHFLLLFRSTKRQAKKYKYMYVVSSI